MVIFDANYLMHLLHPDPGRVIDPETNQPVDRIREKIEYLVETLGKAQDKIVIPTPVLSEIAALDPEGAIRYQALLSDTSRFDFAPFDVMAAIEAGIQTNKAIRAGDKRGGTEDTWAKVKFDRQIVAIAKTRQITTIYSNDTGVRAHAARVGIVVIPVWELPSPPPQQCDLNLEPSTEELS
jgi:predicted nucleic acid-binding protein